MAIDSKFWDGTRWDGHGAFRTVNHHHVSCYSPADGHDTCDIMVVECADARWYVEDNWGGDAKGEEGVWNPFDPRNEGPRFFSSEAEAMKHAIKVVAKVSGVTEASVGSI